MAELTPAEWAQSQLAVQPYLGPGGVLEQHCLLKWAYPCSGWLGRIQLGFGVAAGEYMWHPGVGKGLWVVGVVSGVNTLV